MKIKTSKHVCGFCKTNTHHYCPGRIRQKDGEELVACPCDCEYANTVRCLVCGNTRSDECDPERWVCHDAASCIREVDRKREKAKEQLFPQGHKSEIRANKPACRCECGELTGGGKFRPGHDGKFVSQIIKKVKAGEMTPAEAKDRVGLVSAGLLGKLVGKV